MTYTITKREVNEQPVLVGCRRVPRSEIANAIGEVLGLVFQHAQRSGIELTGPPFVRYLDGGSDVMTLEPGMRVATPEAGQPPEEHLPEDGGSEAEIRRDALPGGFVATTIHSGPYDALHEAYAALGSWMESEGLTVAGAPWESYLTDPTQVPDPKDWRTEVCWPVN